MLHSDLSTFLACGFGVVCGFILGPKLEKWLFNLISKWRNKK